MLNDLSPGPMPPSNLTRRRLLQAAGVSAGATIAGCLGRADPHGSPTASPPDESGNCPTYDESVRTVVCYEASDAETPQMYLDPSKASISLPKSSMTFTLENTRNKTFNMNPYGWRLHKLVDGTWHFLQPWIVKQPLLMLASGKSYSWDITVDNTKLDQPIEQESGANQLTFSGLGSGRYAFGVEGWFDNENGERETAYVTTFEVEGDPMELTPTTTVTETNRSGESVTVNVGSSGEQDRHTLIVTRVDETTEITQSLITEQVMLMTPIRNALAYFDTDIRQVRVESPEDAEFMLRVYAGNSSNGEETYIEYEGQTYLVERRPAGTES